MKKYMANAVTICSPHQDHVAPAHGPPFAAAGFDAEDLERILQYVNEWWANRQVPDNLALAKVLSLYRKGDPGSVVGGVWQ